jgi:transposase
MRVESVARAGPARSGGGQKARGRDRHQRLVDAGVTISRSSLTHWMQRSAELLLPIYRAQQASILRGSLLTMDETPIKAARKKGQGAGKGKMKQGYFWPMLGDQDEICLHFAPSRGEEVRPPPPRPDRRR